MRVPFSGIISLLGLICLTGCSASAAPAAATSRANSPTPEPAIIAQNLQFTATPSPRPSATATSSPTPTPTPSPRPTATDTPTPLPTSTPAPALKQLTDGACCVQPFFSPDGQQILFIDKPATDDPEGIYGVDLLNPQPEPQLIDETIGFRSADRSIVATIDGNLARFVNELTGESWAIDTNGNWPRFSPDGMKILWDAQDREGPYDRRRSDIWLADLDGENRRMLLSVTGGGYAGWLPDSQGFLLIIREEPGKEERTLQIYDLVNDQRIELAREKRLRGVEISPDGQWIAYFVSFADDPERNGLWVVSRDGTRREKLEIPGFGSFRWRDETTLFYIPMRSSSEESMQLWAVDVMANQAKPITDPDSLFFSISNGDWEVSPNGQDIAFVNSADQNIWLITLP